MSNNVLWIVCAHHADRTQALCLGKRMKDGYYNFPNSARMDAFFEEHKHCGGGHDHFTVAYDRPKDWDVGQTVAEAVATALSTGRFAE